MSVVAMIPRDLEKLKVAYEEAVKSGAESFVFTFKNEPGGRELLTSYAKYLIEYLESRFSG